MMNIDTPINTRDEAINALDYMGTITRELARLDLDIKEREAKAKAQAALDNDKDIKAQESFTKQYNALELAVATWATHNRDELTNGGKVKTVKLPTGSLSWKEQKASVVIEQGIKDDVIIVQLHEQGLERFIATKESLDKAAILKDPKAILSLSGISVSSIGEICAVKPN
jgi:phage host-nuclease inhibitor protein Gam